MPKTLVKDEVSATDIYAKFIAEPFEAGYGHTLGNSLRRVLLSSLEGAAITSVRIEGAPHEFTSLPGVVEDVVDIILNLKKVKFKAPDHDARTATISVTKEGAVTAADIQCSQGVEVVNPTSTSARSTESKSLTSSSRSRSDAALPPATRTNTPTSRSASSRSTRFSRRSPASNMRSRIHVLASAPITTS